MITALTALFISGFTSATLLPGTSEAGFILFLNKYPASAFLALLLLTIANTLGSLTSYGLAYTFPKKNFSQKTEDLLKKYGTPITFFSFLPFVGDGLPLAAGWLKLPIAKTVFFIGMGKFIRYAVLMFICFQAV